MRHAFLSTLCSEPDLSFERRRALPQQWLVTISQPGRPALGRVQLDQYPVRPGQRMQKREPFSNPRRPVDFLAAANAGIVTPEFACDSRRCVSGANATIV